ncbi:MAG: radical SAM protein, partial [Gemmatimonadetes bacterium]|nr:radical SAM protein [Gemmatimonadota bacterium]
MISSHFKPYHIPLFLAKYAWLSMRRMPMLVHFEVTMRCNARCGFCDYWQTPASEKANELTSFADAARHFSPMMITFTGGEPLLRRDLEELVRAVREASRLTYITLITHGGMLSLERARALWDAGIDQFNISLDYLDGRHDVARGIPGLTQKILSTVQAMRADGIDGIRFNTVIKNDNVDQLLPIVERAAALGIGVNFSLYTDFKNGNKDHL